MKEIQNYFEHKPVEPEPTCSKNDTLKKEKQKEEESKISKVYEDINLSKFDSIEKLENLGLDHLKHILKGQFF